jgi:Na+-driven multidrug efflux pump
VSNKKESWFDFGDSSPLKIFFIVVFGILYFSVWIPVSFIFPWKEYIPGPFGIPAFIWVMLIIQIITGIVFFLLYRLPDARKLYEDEEE